MKTRVPLFSSLVVGGICFCLPACLNLKPAHDSARHFVLTPIAAGASGSSPAPLHPVAFGLGKVVIPAYLLRDPLAVRQGVNEVHYLDDVLWAERLDNGLQRVLAEDLACLLTTDHVRLSTWTKEQVQLEIYVTLEQFDVDTQGQGEICARWRVLSPGGDRTLKTGRFNHLRKGPTLTADPQGAVATLSLLAEDLSREVAKDVETLAPHLLPVP